MVGSFPVAKFLLDLLQEHRQPLQLLQCSKDPQVLLVLCKRGLRGCTASCRYVNMILICSPLKAVNVICRHLGQYTNWFSTRIPLNMLAETSYDESLFFQGMYLYECPDIIGQ